MTDSPLVSVIVIFYNPSGAYLREAIDSVFAQTCEDWELLLVDDGSSDDAPAVAQAVAAAHPDRVRYLTHPGGENRGMSASRNRGIEAAQGRYVAFLDADDTFMPERLAHQVSVLDDTPEAMMVYGPTLYWRSWEAGAREPNSIVPTRLRPFELYRPPSILYAYLKTRGAILPGICSLTARREAVRHVGGFEAEFRGCYEDQVFLAKMCAHHCVIVTDQTHARYRQHDASCTAQAAETGEYQKGLPNPALERYLRWLDRYLDANGLMTVDLKRELRRSLWPFDHPEVFRRFVRPFLAVRLVLKRYKRAVQRWLRGCSPASWSGRVFSRAESD